MRFRRSIRFSLRRKDAAGDSLQRKDTQTEPLSAERELSAPGRGFRSRQYGCDHSYRQCGGIWRNISRRLHRSLFSQERPREHERHIFREDLYGDERSGARGAFGPADFSRRYGRGKYIFLPSARKICFGDRQRSQRNFRGSFPKGTA